jgi:hypothetical protein
MPVVGAGVAAAFRMRTQRMLLAITAVVETLAGLGPILEWDLMEKRLDCAWVFAPVAQHLGALQQSSARYPHIAPGQEFTGYARV